jgi:hypothetical protein
MVSRGVVDLGFEPLFIVLDDLRVVQLRIAKDKNVVDILFVEPVDQFRALWLFVQMQAGISEGGESCAARVSGAVWGRQPESGLNYSKRFRMGGFCQGAGRTPNPYGIGGQNLELLLHFSSEYGVSYASKRKRNNQNTFL